MVFNLYNSIKVVEIAPKWGKKHRENQKNQFSGVRGLKFVGEFEHNIDAKNRLFIPSRFREALGETFIICKAPEKCLFIYSEEGWADATSPLEAAETTSAEQRQMQRQVYRGSALVEVDKQGRITVPKRFREYANLEKEVTIVGVGKRIEVWNTDLWEETFEAGESLELPELNY